MRTALTLLLLTPALAMATPRTLAQQGRLLGVDGTPLNGTVDLQVSLYGQSTGGTALFTEAFDDVVVSGGYYSIVLGQSTSPLQDDDLDGGERYLGIAVNNAAELAPRTPIASVAYAHRADVATRVVSIDDNSPCTATNNGAMRFTTALNALDVCVGGTWLPVTEQSGPRSCKQLFDAGNTTDGVYTINPGDEGPIDLYCDMTTDGGGWTLVAKTNGTGTDHWSALDLNVATLTSPTLDANASLGDERRSDLGSLYRSTCAGQTNYAYVTTPEASAQSADWETNHSWRGTFSDNPLDYTLAAVRDCAYPTCQGPALQGRNWLRTNFVGCGLRNDGIYDGAGTLWVK